MSVELLAIAVGASICKGLFHAAVKGPQENAYQVAGSALIDVLKNKGLDFFEAADSQSEIENLERRVAKRIHQEVDQSYLAPSSQEAVLQALVAALAKGCLTPTSLVKADYDPEKVVSHVQEKHPDLCSDLTQSERELFRRCVSLAAVCTIDLSSAMPQFTNATARVLLERTQLACSQLSKVLDDLETISAVLPRAEAPGGDPSGDFEFGYRAAVARRFNQLELLGVDVAHSLKRYSLELAYVSLQVASEEREPTPLPEAIPRDGRLCIVGEAGSGKTTILRWLAVKTAAGDLPAELSFLGGRVPFLLELRAMDRSSLSLSEGIRASLPEVADSLEFPWVEEALKSGRALILIDGLDEVPPDGRTQVLDWIRGLMDFYPEAGLVLASRPGVFSGAGSVRRPKGLPCFSVAPLSVATRTQLIQYWHRKILVGTGIETEEDAAVFEQRLLTRISDEPALSSIGSNPLLCAMLCALSYRRNMDLPTNRNELYEHCVSMLLERRDKDRGLPADDLATFSYSQKRLLVQDLAYWMVRNGYTSVEEAAARARVLPQLTQMNLQLGEPDAEPVLSALLERSGLVRRSGTSGLDFVHRTFQEYLAALEIVRQEDWGLLLDSTGNDQWHEVAVLAMAEANPHSASSFIEQLLRQSEEQPSGSALVPRQLLWPVAPIRMAGPAAPVR